MSKRAFKAVRLQALLRIIWFVFCSFVITLWINVYFDVNLRSKKCYVREDADGSLVMLNYVDESQKGGLGIIDVSSRFEILSFGYLSQAFLSLITCGYQLLAIYCIDSLLAYRFYVSRINKAF